MQTPMNKSSGNQSAVPVSGAARISIRVGNVQFIAVLEQALAPRTCALFRGMLPLHAQLIHCRWSGESMWVPLRQPPTHAGLENQTGHPTPGQILLYSSPDFDEPEILIPYGACSFSSKVGPLAGNHFLTITHGLESLNKLGLRVLWDGAEEIAFEAM
jgi:hypothetical protein